MDGVIHNPYKSASPLDQKCVPKAIMSYVAGGAMGFVMAAFMSAMEMRDFDVNRQKRATKYVLKKDLRRMIGTAKSFATFGGIIILYECMIEHIRVKDDGMNTFLAGAATTMVLGANVMRRKQLLISGLGGGFMCYGFYKVFKMLGY